MTFNKEQLQQIIETDHVQCGDASALARIALASLTAEPVFEVEVSGNHWLNAGPVDDSDFSGMPDGVNRLYAAPPAPVVPDLKPIGFLFSSEDGGVTYSPSIWPIEGFNLIGQIYGDVNACRAAMLQGGES